MSDDCTHGHTSYSEESYFYKETSRLVSALRRMSTVLATNAPIKDSTVAPAAQRLAA